MTKYESIAYVENEPIRILDFYLENSFSSEIDYHYHRSLEILLPIIGTVTIFCNGECRDIRPGQIYIVNSKDIHYLIGKHDQGYYKGYAFQIPYQVLYFCEKDINQIRFVNTLEIHRKLIPLLYQILLVDIREYKYKRIDISRITLDMIKTLLEEGKDDTYIPNIHQKTHKGRIIEIIEYIKSHYTEGLTVSGLAKHFHYSYGYFEKMFKDNMGITVSECIKDIQLQHVEESLLKTDDSIVEISGKVGFSNVKALNRCFKEKYNIPPNQYRMKMRNRPHFDGKLTSSNDSTLLK